MIQLNCVHIISQKGTFRKVSKFFESREWEHILDSWSFFICHLSCKKMNFSSRVSTLTGFVLIWTILMITIESLKSLKGTQLNMWHVTRESGVRKVLKKRQFLFEKTMGWFQQTFFLSKKTPTHWVLQNIRCSISLIIDWLKAKISWKFAKSVCCLSNLCVRCLPSTVCSKKSGKNVGEIDTQSVQK